MHEENVPLATAALVSQHKASPVVVNSIVSSLLLQLPDSITVEFDEFLQQVKDVYSYLSKLDRFNMSAMRLSPNNLTVLSVIRKLGFFI